MNRLVRITTIMCLALSTLTFTSCGLRDVTAETSDGSMASPGLVVLQDGTPIVSIESPGDVADWASYLLLGTAVDETQRNSSPVGPGEKLLGRDVTVAVEAVLWEHPEAVTDVVGGQNLTVYTFPGYFWANGDIAPAVEQGDTRMVLGERYVLVMADDVAEDGAQVLTLLEVLPPEADSVTLPSGEVLELAAASAELDSHVRRGYSRDQGPRPGESLVERLERYSVSPGG